MAEDRYDLPIDVDAFLAFVDSLQDDPAAAAALEARPIAELADRGILRVAGHVSIMDTSDLSDHVSSHPNLNTAAINVRFPGGGGLPTRVKSI